MVSSRSGRGWLRTDLLKMKFQTVGLKLSHNGEETPLPEETFPQKTPFPGETFPRALFLPGMGPTQSIYKEFLKTSSLISQGGLCLWEGTYDVSQGTHPPCEGGACAGIILCCSCPMLRRESSKGNEAAWNCLMWISFLVSVLLDSKPSSWICIWKLCKVSHGIS